VIAAEGGCVRRTLCPWYREYRQEGRLIVPQDVKSVRR
jgi:hypothetical protein